MDDHCAKIKQIADLVRTKDKYIFFKCFHSVCSRVPGVRWLLGNYLKGWRRYLVLS